MTDLYGSRSDAPWSQGARRRSTTTGGRSDPVLRRDFRGLVVRCSTPGNWTSISIRVPLLATAIRGENLEHQQAADECRHEDQGPREPALIPAIAQHTSDDQRQR